MTESPAHTPARGAAHKRVAVILAMASAPPVIGAGAASAQVGGGTTAPGDPQVLSIQCVTRCIGPDKGVAKSKIRLLGTDLGSITMVSLPRADGTRAKDKSPVVRPSGAVLSKVVKGAVTGPVRIADTFGQVRDSSVAFTVGTIAELKAVQAQYRFPLQAPHTYGDGFGAPRDGHSHQGVDIFAACGSPLVAAHSGVVKAKAFQGAAGNYVVIDAAGIKQDYMYVHLKKPASVAKGQQVSTGPGGRPRRPDRQRLGLPPALRDLGRRRLVHGRQADRPVPTLKYWDSFS